MAAAAKADPMAMAKMAPFFLPASIVVSSFSEFVVVFGSLSAAVHKACNSSDFLSSCQARKWPCYSTTIQKKLQREDIFKHATNVFSACGWPLSE